MNSFLRNLALLAILIVALYLIYPDIIMKGVLGLYSGLAILPALVIFVILAAMPRHGRRRW